MHAVAIALSCLFLVLACRSPILKFGASDPHGFFSKDLSTTYGNEAYCPKAKNIYYHWGPTPRLDAWLNTIGHKAGEAPSPMNVAMMTSVLASADPNAILGQGLYLADSPLVSIQYGNQLLLVRVKQDAGEGACAFVNDLNLRQFIGSRDEGKAKLAKGLPSFVAYREQVMDARRQPAVFYILRGFPPKKEKLTISVSVATASDARAAATEYFETMPTKGRNEADLNHNLTLLVQTLERMADAQSPMTPEAKEFLAKFMDDSVLPAIVAVMAKPTGHEHLRLLSRICSLATIAGLNGAGTKALKGVPGIDCKRAP